MGHYNQIVFSEFNNNITLEEISQQVEKTFSSFSLPFYADPTARRSKSIQKYWDVRWNYDKDELDASFGELFCYIVMQAKKYHLIIGDSSSFRIDYSEKTYKKFCELCLQLCDNLFPKFAIYAEEPSSLSLLAPSHLNRALEILELYNNYSMPGLVIIHKNEITLQKAQQIVPVNGKLVPKKDFYVYEIYSHS